MNIVASTEREVIALLEELHTLRQAIRETQARERAITEAVKAYMEQRGLEVLEDGEKGYVARLQVRRGSPTYDVRSMPDALVLRLKELAALSVDAKVVRALHDKVAEVLDLRPYAIPGPETAVLLVERKEE